MTNCEGVTVTDTEAARLPHPYRVHVSDCGHVKLDIYRFGNIFAAQLGPYTVYSVHGICQTCGMRYHWTSGDEKLRRLVER